MQNPGPAKILRVALLGNPNTGKTTLFNALTGLNHRVGNYPGVTVEIKKGRFSWNGRQIDLLDIPGTYSLAPRSPDEMLSVELVLGLNPSEPKPDLLILVIDASNLERNLFLATQALESGIPAVMALTMVDVAKKNGIQIDQKKLAESLGLPVVEVMALKREGLEELKKTLVAQFQKAPCANGVNFPALFEKKETEVLSLLGTKASRLLARRLLLETDGYLAKALALKKEIPEIAGLAQFQEELRASGLNLHTLEARTRYGWIKEKTAPAITRPEIPVTTWTDKMDRYLTHRGWGLAFFLLIMFCLFQAIFTLSKPLIKWINEGKGAVGEFLSNLLPQGMLASLVVDGLVEGVGSVVVFLPQILILFGFLAILEDCGYMARAAFLMDRVMVFCGLTGKSFIPLLSSAACAVPGILSTRVIEDKRDRLTTILVAPLVSCSARLQVYSLLIQAFLSEGRPFWFPGFVLFCLYGLGMVLAPLTAWLLKKSLLKGKGMPFLMELPSYKRPSGQVVAMRVWDGAWSFMRRAGTLIAATMVLVWAVLYFPHQYPGGGTYPERIATEKENQTKNALLSEWKSQSYLGRAGHLIEPLVKPLGWDWRIGVATLASFPAREVVIGTLGIIFGIGQDENEAGQNDLEKALRNARWNDKPGGKPLFDIPTALSLMVFFALCSQCVSTLVVIKQEAGHWGWALFTFVYMTVLAYAGAFATYQIGVLL
ncbi:MAG: ferrous iron transport protein B [Gemmataceae bacterium]|nr:ferrous iron transport protein B [Gemmataceae bacterium]